MIRVTEIKKHCYAGTYTDGKEDFQKGRVKNLERVGGTTGDGVDEIVVTGDVKVRGMQTCCSARLDVTWDDRILDCSCTCFEYVNYWSMCRHCVALALAYQDDQKRRRARRESEFAGIHRNTSASLKKMMTRYSMQNRVNRLGGPDGEVNLECSFQSQNNGLLLECRIGIRRMYVVRNLVKLVRDVQEMRDVRYGANLEFVHDRSAFSPDAAELLDLLEQAVATHLPEYRKPYYESSNNYRYLLLRTGILELFMNHFLGREIRLDEQMVPVREGNPSVTLQLAEMPGGAAVSMEYMDIFDGRQYTFIWKDGVFWRCTPEFSGSVMPLWQTINGVQASRYQSQPALFLSRDDYGSFCGNVMPALGDLVTVESGSLNLADYAPAEPEFSVYLTMPDRQRVEATARVRYDEEPFDLLAPAKEGGVFRNLEREQDVKGVLEKYFHAVEAPAETEPPAPEEKPARRRRGAWLDDVPSRDLDEDVRPSLPAKDAVRMAADGEDDIYRLLDGGLAELERVAELFVDDSIRNLRIQSSPRVTMGIGFAGNFLDLNVQVAGMEPSEIAGILGSYRRRKKYYRMKNGDFVRLENGGVGTLSELAEGLNLSEKELASGHAQVERYRALYLENVLRDAGESHVRRTPDYRALIRDMRDFSDSGYELPENLNAEMRTYQVQGYQWLCTLYACGFGGILADDMGLGKTLQMIALLLAHKGGEQAAPSLVVSPASLVYNWESEVRRFAPDLSVQVIAGTAQERREQMEHAGEFDVNITSYDLLKRDIDICGELSFDCCVADEAQYIKNASTQASKAVKRVRAAHRFALTGTPIENRLSDLWSIFDFLMPGYLFEYRKFREEFETAIVKNSDDVAVKRLQRMVTPFILRRKKQDVLKDLPDKLEEAVYIRMTEEQEAVYRATEENLRLELTHKSDEEIRGSRIQILAQLTRLRQLCCSPELCYEDYHGGSGKIDTCLELLKNAVEGGHGVLVFSQFTTMLELLIREWAKTGMEYRYLSGRDSKLARKKMVEDFQTGTVPVFFISLKAGGTGLNLTAADIVIHCDPWWNVAAQNQATDRAHRIGQEHVVNVMKLVARDTIEEKILALQQRKAALADSVVEGEGVQDFTLDRETLMELFR